jgi:hypothetical protein
MDSFSQAAHNERICCQRSAMLAGIELHYNVNLDQLMGAGGQGEVYQGERRDDRLQVAIKVTPRSKLRPGPGVCPYLPIFKIKPYLNP